MPTPTRNTTHALALVVLTGGFWLAPSAQASSLLALDKGCMSCHGNTPQKKAPTFAQLATAYGKYKDQPGADVRLADELRAQHVFGGIRAHETLTPDSALTLVRWIIQGAN